MKVVIRDDDTCYYTCVNELEDAFSSLNVPITLSVIPFACYNHADTNPFACGLKKSDNQYEPIGENKEIVEYLKKGIKQGKFEIALHGFHHEYYKLQTGWREETQVCSSKEQTENMKKSKEYLESLFGVRVTEFVAPSNSISETTRKSLDEVCLNTNAVTGKRISKSFSGLYIFSYIKKQIFDLIYKEKYCGVMNYRNHKEIAMFEFVSIEKIMKQYEYCKKHNFDLVLFTHYWNLNADSEKKKELIKFIDIVKKDGNGFGFLSDCF